MLFPTLAFTVFFFAVFTITWALNRDNEWRKIFLLAASWVFYGAWDWRFVTLLIFSGFLNWGLAALIVKADDKEHMRKFWVTLGVIGNLVILGFFKYYNFFLEEFGMVLEAIGWHRDMAFMEVVLPIGISFFTFQGMSYLIDIYRRKTEPAVLLDIVLLMSFFPHLVAGPIVRASHLVPQFQRAPTLTRSMVASGIVLICWGLVKKVVIASELATGYVDPLFFDPSTHSSIDLLFGAYGYAVQIYCDFSAYSDMAIGLAALLGYRFPANFNQPYRSESLQTFWRRWHISLSSWLRDYLYIGMGGSRHGQVRTYIALSMTMLLGGLWHGASWNFVIWGALHGGVLALERAWGRHRPDGLPPLPSWVRVVLTFHFVTFAWIFFRLVNFADAEAYLGQLFSFTGGVFTLTPLSLALIIIGMALHFGPPDAIQRGAAWVRDRSAWQVAAMGVTVLLFVEMLRPDGVAPFIYYQF